MMPIALMPAPSARLFKTCIAKYRKQAQTEAVEIVWKRFRASSCGASWFAALLAAYGCRCVYCDHSPVRSIDHRCAKTSDVRHAFAWKNFRPSCGDCNHQKGTGKIVDPLGEDPRGFIEYDVSTGKPAVSKKVTPRLQKKAESTMAILNYQTFNEARRAKRHRVLLVLAGFVNSEVGYDAARVMSELDAAEPHRAIVRDLIFGAEQNLHQWAPLVRGAIQKLPILKTWAQTPVKR